jgi:Spy/CpxP family protein refolding chaperone
MLSTGSFAEEHAHKVVDRLVALDEERNVARVLMLIRIYRALTPSQRIKLEHLSAEASEDRLRRPFVGLLSGSD